MIPILMPMNSEHEIHERLVSELVKMTFVMMG